MNTIQQQLDIPRDKAQQLGQETAAILIKGSYISSSGNLVDIHRLISRSRDSTVTYGPQISFPDSGSGQNSLSVKVNNVTSLAAASSLIKEGYQPAVLNMASATSPGGGFLHGGRAQEEYLCRSSGLYACLLENEMYKRTDFATNPFYDDYVLYSPDVPVFRDDDGELMDAPYPCAFLTSPAVQANAVRKYMLHREQEIEEVMRRRILKLLAVAEYHNHAALVLGAWGCGAFGNDGALIARLFQVALTQNFKGVFAKVIFAITDWSPEKWFIGPFEMVFP